jgi:hypothetical protein
MKTSCLTSVLFVLLFTSSEAIPGQSPAAPIACKVSVPNGIAAGPMNPGPSGYGNRQLSVGPFGLWPEGTVVFEPGGSGFVTQNGSLGMKFGWQHAARGHLKITGRRLDAPAPPLRADVSDGQGEPGFVATHIIFSTPGCWEVTGQVGDAKLTFVTRVVKIGDGPSWRPDED